MTSQSMRGPPIEVFDGLDDLEEEEEVEEVDAKKEEEKRKERDKEEAVAIVLASGNLGDGLQELQSLWQRYRDTEKDLDLNETQVAQLHAALERDIPKCPAVETVAWAVRTLEDIGLEDDHLFQVFGEILTKRADELQPQSVLDCVVSYGNVYWVGEGEGSDELLDALAGAARRQLNDFTQAEIARLSNGFIRMGGIDDTRHAGLFFEMRQRVNLPDVDAFIKEAMQREGSVDTRPGQEVRKALNAFSRMPNKALKAKAEKLLQWDMEGPPAQRAQEQVRAQELIQPPWEAMKAPDFRMFKSQATRDMGEDEEEEDSEPRAFRFQDLAATEAPEP